MPLLWVALFITDMMCGTMLSFQFNVSPKYFAFFERSMVEPASLIFINRSRLVWPNNTDTVLMRFILRHHTKNHSVS